MNTGFVQINVRHVGVRSKRRGEAPNDRATSLVRSELSLSTTISSTPQQQTEMASRRLANVVGRYDSSLNAGITTLITMSFTAFSVTRSLRNTLYPRKVAKCRPTLVI